MPTDGKSAADRLKIGVSSCFDHADVTRNLFKGKTLLYAEESFLKWIQRSGAIPILVPSSEKPITLEVMADYLDALILAGGADMSPKSYGEEPLKPEWEGDLIRDQYEIALIHQFQKKEKPILGVCRGLQTLNVACGGTLYQDIKTQIPDAQVHRDAEKYDQLFHEVEFLEGSLFGSFFEKSVGKVNSVHHQAIKTLAEGFEVEARSLPDHVIEAIRHKEEPIWAFQWHPEFQNAKNEDLVSASVIVEEFLETRRKPTEVKIVNPTTEDIIQEIDTDSAESVRKKFENAKEAQIQWASTDLSDRKKIVTQFDQLLAKNVQECAEVQTAETGKPISQSSGEIKAVSKRIRFFIDHVEPATEALHPNPKEKISFEPLGVIGNISAWNYPYFVGANVFVPALLTGNAVLYKPSELSTLTGLKIVDLFERAGLPDGLFQTVVGDGKTGVNLLKQDLDGLFFTGSYPTGRKIAEQLYSQSSKFPQMQLELGGKDPTLVCEDVDIDSAAEGLADGAFYNTGQSCCSVERIYVRQEIHESFVDKFVDTVKKFKIGDPKQKDTYIGPLTRKDQMLLLEQQVKDAVSKGASLQLGGKRIEGKGYYFQPSVMTDVTSEMKIMSEESFGPIIGIQSVNSDEEAVRLMNQSDYGLTAGVYTKDKERATRLMKLLDAGSVYWNCCDRISPSLPWTGRRKSGIGSTLSEIGIRTFTRPKAWHLNG